MVNAGNTRRENTQAYLIPLLAQAGFNVVADNCDGRVACSSSVCRASTTTWRCTSPRHRRTRRTSRRSFACDQIPSEENDYQGQNQHGWCNEEATADLHDADVEPDPAAREELDQVGADGRWRRTTSCCRSSTTRSPASWRTDKVGGPLDGDTANYRAFDNFHQWEDVDGDGTDRHRRRAVAGLPEPGHRVRQLLVVRLDRAFPLLPAIWDTDRTTRPSRSPTW